jgi:hypothetical protein
MASTLEEPPGDGAGDCAYPGWLRVFANDYETTTKRVVNRSIVLKNHGTQRQAPEGCGARPELDGHVIGVLPSGGFARK